MEAIVNLFLGDPIYDRNGQMVKRDFGVKNILMIVVVGYIGYSLRGKIGVKSGRRKMRGGSVGSTRSTQSEEGKPIKIPWAWVGVLTACIAAVILLLAITTHFGGAPT